MSRGIERTADSSVALWLVLSLLTVVELGRRKGVTHVSYPLPFSGCPAQAEASSLDDF